MNLKDKVAIVTGAGRGIGREYALALAGEGAKVCVADLKPDWADSVAGLIGDDRAIATEVDVASAGAVKRMVDATVKAFGSVDILVNNAAVFADDIYGFNPLGGADSPATALDHWLLTFRVNVCGMVNSIEAVVPEMTQRGGGKIINQASAGAFVGVGMRQQVPGGVFAGMGSYAGSKLAVVELTKHFAGILAPLRINVNAVAPGMIKTEAVLKRGNRTPQELEDYLANFGAQVPWGRAGEPEELLGCLLFLAGTGSDYVTGQTIAVDGGWTRRP